MLSRLMLKFYRALLEFLRLRRDDALLLPHIDSSRAGDDTAAPPASDRR